MLVIVPSNDIVRAWGWCMFISPPHAQNSAITGSISVRNRRKRKILAGLSSAALCASMVPLVTMPMAHADELGDNTRPAFGRSGNVNTTNVETCNQPGQRIVHVSIPVQVSPSVLSSDHGQTVDDAVIAVPKSFDNVKIVAQSVAGLKRDGSGARPTPVIHDVNQPLRVVDADHDDDFDRDKATDLALGAVRISAKDGGFGDGSHDTDKLYDVYDVDALATVPEIGGQHDESLAHVVNYRVEADLNLDEVAAAPIAVKAGAWRANREGSSPSGSAAVPEWVLSQYEWGRVSNLPDYRDDATMSQLREGIVEHAGVDYGDIRANLDGDAVHIHGDVHPNPSRDWASGYAKTFDFHANRAVTYFVSGFGTDDDGFDMGLVEAKKCDAPVTPTPTPSDTPTPSVTPIPSDTPSVTPTPSPSDTSTPSVTPTPSDTPTPVEPVESAPTQLPTAAPSKSVSFAPNLPTTGDEA